MYEEEYAVFLIEKIFLYMHLSPLDLMNREEITYA